jgi:hypothetical protein
MAQVIRWGVLGASNFAATMMGPAIHEAEGAQLVAVGTSSPAKTLEYALDALADGKLNRRDNDTVEDDCHLLNRRATASARQLEVVTDAIADDVVLVHLRGGVRNPLLPKTAPSVDWDLSIGIDFSLATPSYRVSGSHDGFPAVEIYVNDKLAYRFDPGPPACQLDLGARSLASYCGRQIDKLGGALDVRIRPRQGPIALSG